MERPRATPTMTQRSSIPPTDVLYAYCLLRSAAAPDVAHAPAGLPRLAAPRAVRLGDDRWLVAADAPAATFGAAALEQAVKDLDWVSACAVAHEGVLEHFLDADALLPMKLFTVYASEASALAALRAAEPRTTTLLDHLAGHVEVGVRVRFVRAPEASPVAAPAAGAGAGRAFLEAKKEARDAQRDAAAATARGAARLDAALGAVASATRSLVPPPGAPATGLLLDAAYLVRRERLTAFEATLAEQARALRATGGECVLTGPWPAYHFLEPPE